MSEGQTPRTAKKARHWHCSHKKQQNCSCSDTSKKHTFTTSNSSCNEDCSKKSENDLLNRLTKISKELSDILTPQVKTEEVRQPIDDIDDILAYILKQSGDDDITYKSHSDSKKDVYQKGLGELSVVLAEHFANIIGSAVFLQKVYHMLEEHGEEDFFLIALDMAMDEAKQFGLDGVLRDIFR